MIYIPKGSDAIVIKGKGQAFTPDVKKYIKLAKPKDRYFFSEIKVKGDDGSSRTLPSLAIECM